MEQVLSEVARKMIADRATGQVNNATLGGARVYLVNAPFAPTPTLGVTDLPQPTFPGYAPSAAIAWDASLVGPGSQVSVEGQTVEFLANGTVAAPETVYGVFLGANVAGNGATPDTVLATELFDTPVGISRSGQGLRYTPHFEYP